MSETLKIICKSSSADARKTYSAKELAEVYMTSREDFMGIDLEVVSINWNPNYIFEFLKHIGNLSEIDDAIEWMICFWEEKEGLYDSFDKRLSLSESHTIFKETLKAIRTSVAEWIEKKAKRSELREKMLHGYTHNTLTASPSHTVATEKTQTSISDFKRPTPSASDGAEIKYSIKLEDLPESIRHKVIVSQQVFDVFVEQLNVDVWNTVHINKGKYCDPLRFLCIKREIVSSNMERDDFDILLHNVVYVLKDQPSLMSSMGRYKLTSSLKIQRSLACYDSPLPKHQKEVWQLIDDCKPLEEGLQPVYDAMQAEAFASQTDSIQE